MGAGLASSVGQDRATLFLPEQATAPIPASGTVDAAAVYTDGTDLLLSINGGAYSAILTAGSVTLQLAYTGGAAIVQTATKPIALSTAAGVASDGITVTTATIASNASVGYTWTRNAVPTAASTFTGRAISVQNAPVETNSFTDASTGLVLINHAPVAGAGTMTDATVGLAITMTPIVAATGAGLSITMGANGVGNAATVVQSGTAATRTISMTSAQTAGSVLSVTGTGVTGAAGLTGLTVDLSGATANANAVIGLSITIPASTRAATNGEAALVISSLATHTACFEINTRLDGGFTRYVRWSAATTVVSSHNIDYIDATNISGSTGYVQGYRVDMPATSNSGSYAFSTTTKQTAGRIFSCDFNTSTLLGSLTGLYLNLSTTVTPGAQTVTGISVTIPASSSASTSGIAINSAQTGASSAGLSVTMTATGNVSPRALVVTVGAQTNSATSAFILTTAQTAGNVNHIIATGALTGSLWGQYINHLALTNLTFQVVGNGVDMPATSNVASYGFYLGSAQTGTGSAGYYCSMTGAGTVRGVDVNMTPGGSAAARGVVITMAANTSSSGAAADFVWNSAAGTDGVTNNGVVNIYTNASGNSGKLTFLSIHSRTANLTATNTIRGILVDLTTNVVPSADEIIGIGVTIGASSGAAARGVSIISTQTGAASKGLEVVVTPGSASTVIGGQFTMGANATGAAVSVTHNNVTDAHHMKFTEATGAGFHHLYGPPGASARGFSISAGKPTSSADGTDIRLFASDALTNGLGGDAYLTGGEAASSGGAQVGGNVYLNAGSGAGGGTRGAVVAGGTTDYLGFYGGGTVSLRGAAIADIGAGAIAQVAAGATDCMDKINLILARLRATNYIAT